MTETMKHTGTEMSRLDSSTQQPPAGPTTPGSAENGGWTPFMFW